MNPDDSFSFCELVRLSGSSDRDEIIQDFKGKSKKEKVKRKTLNPVYSS